MVWLTDARTPDGLRLYAIGDVHGCRDALHDLHRSIRADLSARPAAGWRIIHLGDYVDRGSDSRGVIDLLARRVADEPGVLCLRGNHDEMFSSAIAGDRRAADLWLMNGGAETLESYGVPLTRFLDASRSGSAAALAAEAIPRSHRMFVAGLQTSVRFGDYYFVHAGIDPARPLAAQSQDAQLWIREPFLGCETEFEAVVVHGHTPVRRVAVRRNRIGIDTGAVFGGALSCLVLEGASRGLLSEGRVHPLPRAS